MRVRRMAFENTIKMERFVAKNEYALEGVVAYYH